MCRYSGRGRTGQSGMEATAWVSDTSAVCKTSGGVDGSMVLAVTAGGQGGSLTESVSFDGRTVSSVTGTNEGSTGGGIVSVSGADFGASRFMFFPFCTPKKGMGVLMVLRASIPLCNNDVFWAAIHGRDGCISF